MSLYQKSKPNIRHIPILKYESSLMKNLLMTLVKMKPINLELKNVMYKSHILPHIVANNTITNLGFFFKSRTLSLSSSFVPFFSLLNGASVVAFSASWPNVH